MRGFARKNAENRVKNEGTERQIYEEEGSFDRVLLREKIPLAHARGGSSVLDYSAVPKAFS